MKHCNNCNVDVEDKKVHCPLCGKCIDDESAKLGIGNHSDIYPDFKYTSITEFSDGYAVAKKDEKYGFLNKDGKEIK